MDNDEAEPTSVSPMNFLSVVTKYPWALPVMYVMGGGALSFGGMSIAVEKNQQDEVAEVCDECEECPTDELMQRELSGAIDRAEKAEAAHSSMVNTFQDMAARLADCRPSRKRSKDTDDQ